jgi:hypothetical protein
MRKNDQERKSHQMRFRVSTDPQLDLLFQLGLFMDIAGTRPRTNCNGRPNKRCTVCPPLFPIIFRCQAPKGDPTVAHTTRAPAPPFYPGGWGGLTKAAGRLGAAQQG